VLKYRGVDEVDVVVGCDVSSGGGSGGGSSSGSSSSGSSSGSSSDDGIDGGIGGGGGGDGGDGDGGWWPGERADRWAWGIVAKLFSRDGTLGYLVTLIGMY
jgi:hypothetical protein